MIQLLPSFSRKLLSCLNSGNIELYIRLEPAYGLCSISLDYLQSGFADFIIHLGHDFYPYPLCTGKGCTRVEKLVGQGRIIVSAGEYIGYSDSLLVKISGKLKDVLSSGSRLAIGYAVQHRLFSKRLAESLEAYGFDVVGVEPVLGCYYSKLTGLRADYYVVAAGGYFHALGAALALNSGEKVLRVDPYTGSVEHIGKEYRKVIAKRYWLLAEARKAQRFGVIVGSLPGQYRPGIVSTVISLLRRHGKEFDVMYVERLSREYLDNINPRDYDAFVITSCPRLAIDDLGDYWKPILTPGELLMLLRGHFDRYIFPW